MIRMHVLRALGLSLLVLLGLMAFAAAGAQATGEIKVLGSAALATGQTVSGLAEGAWVLVIPNSKAEIICNHWTANGKVLSGPAGTAEANILFEQCNEVYKVKVHPDAEHTVLLEEKLSCHVINDSGHLHVDVAGTGKIVLHGSDSYLLVESSELARIKFLSGTGCPLQLNTVVSGSQAIQVITGDLNLGSEVVEPLLTASRLIQELLKDKLFYGANEAFLYGSGKVFLASATHAGCTWGAI